MRLSEFWIAVDEEFGAAFGRVLAHDLVLGELGDRTAEQALAAGVPAREVWLALCRAHGRAARTAGTAPARCARPDRGSSGARRHAARRIISNISFGCR